MWQGVCILINSNSSNITAIENHIRPCYKMKMNIIYLTINVTLKSLNVSIPGNIQLLLSYSAYDILY